MSDKNTVLLVEPRILEKLPTVVAEYYKYLGNSWSYIFFCGKGTSNYWRPRMGPYVILRELNTQNFNSASEYSFFMKQASLWESLSGQFVLTIQGDTWIKNMAPYTIDYFINLNKSYIGGNMNFVWNELVREKCTFPHYNFNGGLSLRKRQDIIKIIETFPPTQLQKGIIWSSAIETDPEDVYFVLGCNRLGMPLGDDDQSAHFSIHKIMKTAFFGIHQPDQTIKADLWRHYPDIKINAPYL